MAIDPAGPTPTIHHMVLYSVLWSGICSKFVITLVNARRVQEIHRPMLIKDIFQLEEWMQKQSRHDFCLSRMVDQGRVS